MHLQLVYVRMHYCTSTHTYMYNIISVFYNNYKCKDTSDQNRIPKGKTGLKRPNLSIWRRLLLMGQLCTCLASGSSSRRCAEVSPAQSRPRSPVTP